MPKEAETKWGLNPASSKADARLRPQSKKVDTKPKK
jgi:hypothetical protein